MEFLDNLPEGIKWIGGVLGVIGGGFLFLRQYLSSASAERASNDSQIAGIAVWQKLAEVAQLQANLERERSDQFARERNEAIALNSKLQGQLEELNRQVEELRKQVKILTEQLDAKKQI